MLYYVRVRANNAVGGSVWSPVAAGKTQSTIPGVVEKLIANVFKNGATYGAMLSWTPPSSRGGLSILSHRVYVSSGTDGVDGVWDAGRDATSLNFYTVLGLQENTQYMFKVQANNSMGYGPKSAPSSAVWTSSTLSDSPHDLESGIHTATTLEVFMR